MNQVPDFTDTELWGIRTTVNERYGREVPVELVDTEIRLRPGAKELTTCPAVYWAAGRAHFIIVKTDETRYRCQFYYRLHEMFGTGIDEYDDLGECVLTLLQVQADHEARMQQESAQ